MFFQKNIVVAFCLLSLFSVQAAPVIESYDDLSRYYPESSKIIKEILLENKLKVEDFTYGIQLPNTGIASRAGDFYTSKFLFEEALLQGVEDLQTGRKTFVRFYHQYYTKDYFIHYFKCTFRHELQHHFDREAIFGINEMHRRLIICAEVSADVKLQHCPLEIRDYAQQHLNLHNYNQQHLSQEEREKLNTNRDHPTELERYEYLMGLADAIEQGKREEYIEQLEKKYEIPFTIIPHEKDPSKNQA